MTRRLTLLLFALIAAIALFAACGDSDGDATPVVTFEGTDGPSLYSQACASCHGANLDGTDQGPPLLHAFYRPGHHADSAFILAARRGVPAHHWNFGDMPPVEGITDEQVEAIVAFVREQQSAAGIQ